MLPAENKPAFKFFSIRQKILLGFGLAIFAVVVLTGISVRGTTEFIKIAKSVSDSQNFLRNHEVLYLHLLEAETAVTGYVLRGDSSHRTDFETAKKTINDYFVRTVVSEPLDVHKFNEIKKSVLAQMESLNYRMERKRTLDTTYSFPPLGSDEDLVPMRKIKAQIELFRSQALANIEQRAEWNRALGKGIRVLTILGATLTISLLGIALFLILRDIRGRQHVEQLLADERNLLRNLIDAIPEHIFVKDLRGRYVLDNLEHRRFLQVNDMSQVLGKSVFFFFPQELAALYHADDQLVIQTGQPIINREEPAVTAEGNLIWLSTTKVPLRDVNGQLIGLVCVSSDISERKTAEEKMRVFAAQLERSNDELRDFASVASHDLQEPLRKIRAFSDRLRAKCSDALGEQGLDYLDRMQGAAGRMQVLIQDLLTLSRVVSKAQPFVEVDLTQVIKGVLSDLELRIEQTGARVELGYLPKIDADPLQMRQLFQNLLSNALKFQKPGQNPEVIISAKLLELQDHPISGAMPGDTVCQVMVKDNGIGFEEQFVEQIFTLFQRLHSRSAYEGTGIGLAVCRKIAHRHGGSIVAKSVVGAGATFIVTLPVKQITIL